MSKRPRDASQVGLSGVNWARNTLCAGVAPLNAERIVGNPECAGINRHVGVSSEGWRIQWEAVPPG